jgi:hypothetical protein
MKLLGVFRVCSQAVFMTCSVSTTQHKVSRSAQTSTTSSPSKSEIRDEQQRSKRNNSHGAVYLDAADMFLCNSALGSVPKRCRLGSFCRLLFIFSIFQWGPAYTQRHRHRHFPGARPLFVVCGTPPCPQTQGRRTQVPRPCLPPVPQAAGPAPCQP